MTNATTAKAVADKLGLDEYRADLLPEDKVSVIAELQAGGANVAMIGDGINDALHLPRQMLVLQWEAVEHRLPWKRLMLH